MFTIFILFFLFQFVSFAFVSDFNRIFILCVLRISIFCPFLLMSFFFYLFLRFIHCHYHYLYMESMECMDSGGHCALEAHEYRVAALLSTKVWIVYQHRRQEYLFSCVTIIVMPMILLHSIGPTTSINIFAFPSCWHQRLSSRLRSIFDFSVIEQQCPNELRLERVFVCVCLHVAGALLVPVFQLNFGQKENLWKNNNNHIARCGVKQSKFWTLFELLCACVAADEISVIFNAEQWQRNAQCETERDVAGNWFQINKNIYQEHRDR